MSILELPSISTLTRLTLSAKSYNDITYYSKIFLNLTDQQKTCILLLDEVYFNSMLQYHGGEFGTQTQQGEAFNLKKIF